MLEVGEVLPLPADPRLLKRELVQRAGIDPTLVVQAYARIAIAIATQASISPAHHVSTDAAHAVAEQAASHA